MKQGDIYDSYLDPVKGSEQGGRRPVLIISGNALNKFANTVIVCPLTTSIKNYQGAPILEPSAENGLSKTSEVLVVYTRSIDKSRLKNLIGTVDLKVVEQAKKSLNDILYY
ncbi:MAG: type II toxin-antitoxin system PemK/MazF family toxin [Nonlabens sp.]